MGGESICFNPDLLAGYDDKAFAYQEAVDQLTSGTLPDESDPCVDKESVPASFVISGLDPQSQEDVVKYASHRSYYQTRAVLTRWCTPCRKDVPWPPEPASIFNLGNRWLENPLDVIKEVAAFSDRSSEDVTFAKLLEHMQQTDRTLATMEVYLNLGKNSPCSGTEFSLVNAYRLAKDSHLKSRIAEDLFTHFKLARGSHSDPSPSSDDNSFALWREWTAELVPIFIDLHRETTDRKLRERLAEALTGIDGNAGIDYLAGRVLNNSDNEDGAFDTLLSNALVHPEIAPHLARMLWAPASQVSNAHKEQIIEKVAEGRVAPNPKLAVAIAQVLGDLIDGRRNLRVAEYEQQLPRYLAEIGQRGVPLLISLVTRSNKNLHPPYDLRIDALRALAGMDEPAAQAELKKIMRGEYRGFPLNYEPFQGTAAEIIIAGGGPVSLQTMVELLGDPKVVNPKKTAILREMAGYYNWRGDKKDQVAARFFPAVVALRDTQPDLQDTVKETLSNLVFKDTSLLTSIDRYDESAQVFIITTTFYNPGLVKEQNFLEKALTLLHNPRLSPLARQTLKLHFVRLVEEGIATQNLNLSPQLYWVLNKILADSEFSGDCRDQFLERLGRSENGIQVLFDITLLLQSPAIRKQALFSAARSFWTPAHGSGEQNIEDRIVTSYIQRNDIPLYLRLAAVDALKERAKMQGKREKIRAILADLLPLPSAVNARIRSALQK